jgi:hypothetical protein
MVQINFAGREIQTKVVYYGPALCGKTTNLQKLHKMTDPDGETKLFSINTDKDRTLFFDLLPLNVGKIHGFTILLKVFTVPGQVHYSSTRRAVLTGTDAVVFVADSQKQKQQENVESLRDLAVNLQLNGLDIQKIPLVLQYNKRDLKDIVSVGDMEASLNEGGHHTVLASAVKSEGVLDTFIAVVQQMMAQIVDKYRLNYGNRGLDFTSQLIKALEQFRGSDLDDTNPVDMRKLLLTFDKPSSKKEPDYLQHQRSDQGEEPDGNDTLPGAMNNVELIERAVSANMELANIYVQLDQAKKNIDKHAKRQEAVVRMGQMVTSILDIDRLMKTIAEQLITQKGDAVCISLVEGKPLDLKPKFSFPLKTDPIFMVPWEKGKSLAHFLAHQRRSHVLNESSNPAWFQAIHNKYPTIHSVIALPLVSHRRLLGHLHLLTTNVQRRFEEEDLEFYAASAQFLATAIENARLFGMVGHLNRSLESKMQEVQQLNQELHTVVAKKTTELSQANEALRNANTLLQKKADQRTLMLKQLLKFTPPALVFLGDQLKAQESEHPHALLQNLFYSQLTTATNTLIHLETNPNLITPRLFDLGKATQSLIRQIKEPVRADGIKVLTRFEEPLPLQGDQNLVTRTVALAYLYLLQCLEPNEPHREIRIWGEKNRALLRLFFQIRKPQQSAVELYQIWRMSLQKDEGFPVEKHWLTFTLIKEHLFKMNGEMHTSYAPDKKRSEQATLTLSLHLNQEETLDG